MNADGVVDRSGCLMKYVPVVLFQQPDQAEGHKRTFSDVRFFSNDVRFTPKIGHVRCTRPCPLWAKSGYQQSLRVDDAILKGLPRDVSKQIPKPCPDPHRKLV